MLLLSKLFQNIFRVVPSFALTTLNFSFKPLKIFKNRQFDFGTQTCIEKFLAFASSNNYYACTRLELWSASPEIVVSPPGNHHAPIVFVADYVKRATPKIAWSSKSCMFVPTLVSVSSVYEILVRV